MAIDELTPNTRIPSEARSQKDVFTPIFVVLTFLVIAQIYMLSKISSLRGSLQTQDSKVRQVTSQVNEQIASQVAALQSSNAQQLAALRDELDSTAKRMGSTGNELQQARAMVARLQKSQQQQAEQLKQEISKKADEEKVGALTQDVSTTKQTVDTLTKDLGMARSDLGTLIARNHDDIETLRKLGERNYYEFTLTKGQRQTVAGADLVLKKANAKHHQFNLLLLADDMEIPKNNRTVDEPIFFTVSGQKGFYELVVNNVSANAVQGYISTPKYGEETASSQVQTR